MALTGHPQEQTWIKEWILIEGDIEGISQTGLTEQNGGPRDLEIVMVTMVTKMFMRQTVGPSMFSTAVENISSFTDTVSFNNS